MTKKTIWKSKTFWANLIMAIMPLVSNHVEMRLEEFMPQFTMLWGAVNIGLRLITKDRVILVE